MNILTIFTGGTIGSRVTDNIIDLEKNNEYTVLKLFLERYNNYKSINFMCEQPIDFLSENLNYSQWNSIINFLDVCNFLKYDGIIITHGSDTLSYTSALLGLLYSYTKIPIVIVAANKPPNIIMSNAIINLKNAVDFIVNHKVRGVFVSYSNNNDAIYLSTRIKESDPYKDKFASFSNSAFGLMRNSKFEVCTFNDNPTVADVQNNRGLKFRNKINLNKKVLLIQQYPNLDYENYNLNDISSVLIYMYHSGTACTNTENSKSILKFIDRCNTLNIPIYGASFKKSDERYATTYELLSRGLKPMYNISKESAYAKLCIAYNQNEIRETEYIDKNVFFEII